MANAQITKFPITDFHPNAGGRQKVCTKVTDVTLSAANDDVASFIPANCLVLGCTYRVLTTISGTTLTEFNIGVDGDNDAFVDGETTLTAGTTGAGGAGTGNTLPMYFGAADALRVNNNGTAAWAGSVRVEITYVEFTPPAA